MCISVYVYGFSNNIQNLHMIYVSSYGWWTQTKPHMDIPFDCMNRYHWDPILAMKYGDVDLTNKMVMWSIFSDRMG